MTGKPRYFVFIGKPLYPNPDLPNKSAIEDLKERSYQSVKSLLDEEFKVADRFIIFDLARIAAFIVIVGKVITMII